MAISIRNVDLNAIIAALASGGYNDLIIKPEVRRFETVEPILGHRWSFSNPDQSIVNIISVDVKSHCQWCRHPLGENTPQIGIPIAMEIKNGVTYITQKGCMCSFECAAAIIRREHNWSASSRDPNHTNSWQLLNLLFMWCHPGKKLISAPDWTLLEQNKNSTLVANKSTFHQVVGLSLFSLPSSYLELKR